MELMNPNYDTKLIITPNGLKKYTGKDITAKVPWKRGHQSVELFFDEDIGFYFSDDKRQSLIQDDRLLGIRNRWYLTSGFE